MELFIRSGCFLCIDFTRIRLKSDIKEEVDSEEEEEEYQRQLQEEEERKTLLKKQPDAATPPAIKRALTRYEDEEDGGEMYDEIEDFSSRKRKPGVGNHEFFDESAPLRVNDGRKPADETWGDLRSHDQTTKIGGKGNAKVAP